MGRDQWHGNGMRPITFNGYVYGYNSPPNFNDPSGYDPVWCAAEPYDASPKDCYPYSLIEFGGAATEQWTTSEKWQVNKAAGDIARRLAGTYNEYMFGLPPELSGHLGGLMYLFDCGPDNHPLSPREAFAYYYGRQNHGGKVLFYKTGLVKGHYGEYIGGSNPRIEVNKFNYYGDIGYRIAKENSGYRWATHELGHYFEARINGIVYDNYVRDDVLGKDESIERRLLEEDNNYGFASELYGWQQSPVYVNDAGDPLPNTGEEFADMFLGWNYNEWELDPNDNTRFSDAGQARANFMDSHMAPWIALVINQEIQRTR